MSWASDRRRRTAWSPWAELARRPDILLHRCRLDEGRGWWCPDERVILLDDRLDRRAARCVLAHELGHVVLGHTGLPDVTGADRLSARAEVAADQWAARRLVPRPELRRALALYPDDEAAAAAELDVTAEMLRVRLTDVVRRQGRLPRSS
ncbi:ImmA/IrrE family metallo-endopeptidase [Angustibacter sp. Root456]|uniref:ImmA/IrrE family metallo-endopeptidase n=1 Tax=Angustibacter sp. Root456 TaxID=1736539 RepID=UPI001910DEDC|nr:ImmA/IrrE family metallo-endopeptidase [Angustibacter sp. Root456]